jgi:cellulose 1,4-beta-cellobiosidase
MANLTATSFTDTAVTNGITYFYFVEAVNSTGSSSPSNQVSVTPTAGVVITPVPTNLNATAGNSEVTLSWTASAGATSYNLFRGTSAGGENTAAIAQNLTSTGAGVPPAKAASFGAALTATSDKGRQTQARPIWIFFSL